MKNPGLWVFGGIGVLIALAIFGVVLWSQRLGPGHLTCAGSDGAVLFDGPVLNALPPRGARWGTRYAWIAQTADQGDLQITGSCVFLPREP